MLFHEKLSEGYYWENRGTDDYAYLYKYKKLEARIKAL
jgi:hypothetical protein